MVQGPFEIRYVLICMTPDSPPPNKMGVFFCRSKFWYSNIYMYAYKVYIQNCVNRVIWYQISVLFHYGKGPARRQRVQKQRLRSESE